ncbi:unnamed protein product [Oreochromis niloticus]|nr:unnamed protein product [Mustela putorius furo]
MSACPEIQLCDALKTHQKYITAESGQDVTLTCRAPNNNIIVVKWSRADLGDEYVLLYRDEQFDPEGQHPSFKNRVDLQDRQMKDGDVSLILKDVTINDTGTYQCHVYAIAHVHSLEGTLLRAVLVLVQREERDTGEDGFVGEQNTLSQISVFSMGLTLVEHILME